MNNQAIELIAQRIASMLREGDEDVASEAASTSPSSAYLTVREVAAHLGVARSTVYAHWREWGGHKLGAGVCAPIRFDPALLPSASTSAREQPTNPPAREAGRPGPLRRRTGLLVDAPRFAQPLEGLA